MATLMRQIVVLGVLALMPGFLVYLCESCSVPEGWRPPTLVEEILGGRNIYYGRALRKYNNDRTPYDTDYTVELEVFCNLKGQRTPLVINITRAGYIPGHCTSAEFSVNQSYIAIDDDIVTSIKASNENLKNITKACGLNPVTRPEGSTSFVECPVSAADCSSQTDKDAVSHTGTAASAIATVMMTTAVTMTASVLSAINTRPQ